MKRYVKRILLGVLVVLTLSSAAARADSLIITGQETSVSPGGTATVNFYITSNSATGIPLALTNLQLTISDPLQTLSFSQSQPTAPFSGYSANSYVFAGSSLDQDLSIPFWGSPTSTNYSKDTISGGDSNDSGSTSVTSSTSFLLATVQIQASSLLAGGQVNVVDSGSFFLDSNGNSVDFISTPATITPAPAPTPEPTSMAIAAIMGAGGLICVWRNRRSRIPAAKP